MIYEVVYLFFVMGAICSLYTYYFILVKLGNSEKLENEPR